MTGATGQPQVPTTDELDEQIEIQAGRRAPYSQLGDWVALSGIDDHSKSLYWVLMMHVNQTRGDSKVWPAREVLADLSGFNRVQSVDPYVKALKKLGAIDVRKVRYSNGMRARNVYLVHQTPPDGYKGPTSLKEFYELRRAEIASAQADDETAGQPVVRSSAYPGVDDETAGQPGDAVQRTSGATPERTPGDAPHRTPVVRPTAQELDEVELPEVKTTAEPAPVDNLLPSTVEERSSSDPSNDNPEDPEPDLDVVAAYLVAEAPDTWRIDVPTAKRLRVLVADRLRSGWLPADLVAAVGMDGDPAPNTQRPAGLLLTLLRNLRERPAATPATPGAWLESWCANPACDPQTRMVWTDEDQVTRCQCHPSHGKPVGASAGAR